MIYDVEDDWLPPVDLRGLFLPYPGEQSPYYIPLEGIPFNREGTLRCDFCFAPVEAYDGKLERAYALFWANEKGQIYCDGLVCKSCAEMMIYPLKPAPTTEEEKRAIQRVLNSFMTKPSYPRIKHGGEP